MKKYFLILQFFFSAFLFSEEISKDIQTQDAKQQKIEDTKDDENRSKEVTKNDTNISQTESLTSILNEPKNANIKVPTNIDFPKKNPVIAVYSNLIIPGLGHAYLKDFKTASCVFGTSLAGYGAILNRHTSELGMVIVSNTLFYELYSSYRDVRLINQNIGYKYQMPTDSFLDLCLAPFNYKVLKKPEVWGGLLADFAVVLGVGYLMDKLDKNISRKISLKDASPLMAFPVGIGEEAMFRGFMQSALSERFSPKGGIALSSIAFGAAHIPNAYGLPKSERKSYYAVAVPYITLAGAYYGWVTYRNNSLKESVALHTWYDFTLFALDRFWNRSIIPSAIRGKPTIAFAFDF